MSTLSYALRDSSTMLRRDLRHSLRFPMMTVSAVMLPIFFLLLFVGIFGHTLGAGLGAGLSAAGGHYVDYLAPGVILMTASSSAEAIAVSISTDMNEGIITRFRTMAITRTSVLTGQVIGNVLKALISLVLVVAVAVAFGFRPTANPLEWAAAAGLFALFTVAMNWLGVAFGLLAKTPAGANSLSLILVVLPFISSAFVPTASMPVGARFFAEHQPFTPVIQTVRGLLTGTPVGHSAILAIGWSVGLTALGYVWSGRLYDHPSR